VSLARLIHRLRGEHGIAIPLAVLSLMLVLTLSGVVLTQAVRTGDSANREQASKRAVQAADAGIDVAVFRADKVATDVNPCPIIGGTGFASYLTIGGEQWCPEVSEDLGDGKSYSYWVSAPDASGNRTVVASGTAEGVTRRVAVQIEKEPVQLFDEYGVSSDSDITLDSSSEIGQRSPALRTDARANGNITLNSSSNICGNAIPGPGKTVTDASSYGVCPGYSTTPASAPITFPAVDDTVASVTNDNNRICKAALDPCSPMSDVSPNVWDNASRQLQLNSSATLTLRGSVYYFCSLALTSSSRLILDPPSTSKPVLIYIGNCPGAPSPVLWIQSSSRVESAPGKIVPVQFLVKGSTSSATTVRWESSSAAVTPTAVYAPNSNIVMESSARIQGAITGKTVSMSSNAQVIYDNRVDQSPFDSTVQKSATYRECRPQAGAAQPPSAGC